MNDTGYLKPQRLLLPSVPEFLQLLTGKKNSSPSRIFHDWVAAEDKLGLPDKKTLVELGKGRPATPSMRKKLRSWIVRSTGRPAPIFSIRPLLRKVKRNSFRVPTCGVQWEGILLMAGGDKWIPHLSKEVRRLSQLEQETIERSLGGGVSARLFSLIDTYQVEGWVCALEAGRFKAEFSEANYTDIEDLREDKELQRLMISVGAAQWVSLLITAEKDFYAKAEELVQRVNPKNSLHEGLLESLLKRGEDGEQPYLGCALELIKKLLELEVGPFDWSDVVRTSELKFKDKLPLSDRRLREMRHSTLTPKDESLKQVIRGLLVHTYTNFCTESEDDFYRVVSRALLQQWFEVLKAALFIQRLDEWLRQQGFDGELLTTYHRLQSRA